VGTGCASMDENMNVTVPDYRLTLIDYATQPKPSTWDMTSWVKPSAPETPVNVSVTWYGDIDRDNKPDVMIQDCPYEMGCRTSLFLSSKRRKGEYLRKVAEHFWQMD
jgi:hypothetical protein